MEEYIVSLFNEVPQCIYIILFLIFCVGCLILIRLRVRNLGRMISKLLLFEYLFYIICSTLLFRTVDNDVYYNFKPFWSYSQSGLLIENIMNVIMFVPVGVLLGSSSSKMIMWKSLLFGGGLSIIIEVIQYYSKRGVAEFDDVMHNTMGCVIGFGVYFIMRYLYEKFSKRRMAVL